ncbi:MAG: bifunctional UDP-N-acetylmuramoyl-tripeptide:D-alanyl-D-alanine ligase/alanine racemase [Flammeovirgaceae bacterium]|nr:bifunctional UDP-N-acetylmuramoyl-tripeptide:D-alanyl-D-alanine ligase/alanine racemase [Flammeovirgaceae bacterium]
MIYFSQLAAITHGKILAQASDRPVINLLTDSRKLVVHDGSLFFAIRGERYDGHTFISSLYDSGLRQFVVEQEVEIKKFPEANFLRVTNAIEALQRTAAHHRSQFQIPIIGITGSNGKTIVKEWLSQLLSKEFAVAKNPGSFNSQIGVPLAVWALQPYHQLGIFEAGISLPGEMQRLQSIINPTIDIFTNIGSAHDEGFNDRNQKIEEKVKLFTNTELIIFCHDHEDIRRAVLKTAAKKLSWGFSHEADVSIRLSGNQAGISFRGKEFLVTIPFTDKASVENLMHCIALMLQFEYDEKIINQRIAALKPVAMRFELKDGINGCKIIDDSYNNDLAGLQMSLDYLANQRQRKVKRLILSDIVQSGLSAAELSMEIAKVVSGSGVDKLIGIGPVLHENQKLFEGVFYSSTQDFLNHFDFNQLQNELILVKGARSFQFEKIIQRMQKKVHGTVMEIDLNAMVHNLNFFKSRVKPSTKMMVMVKAFAYGSGSVEVANLLQFNRADYLGVAYADEGVELRMNNITLPIMVMNPSEQSFATIYEYNLEPEIYNFRMLNSWLSFIGDKEVKIHVKLDTGMHRLGFAAREIPALLEVLKKNPRLKVASIFSHLAGADEKQHDEFSRQQGKEFQELADKISKAIGYKPLYHLINTPGIIRLPELQFDMVRLGIGLYGINPSEEHNTKLLPVATLKTVVSQIKKIDKDETVGYGRSGKAEMPLTIATIAIGYADGFNRAFSRGVGEVLIHGKRAKVIGNVCMDMTMIDITGIDAKEGDEVIVFGKELPVEEVAAKINTIPYEILTNTSERVKRVFVAEGL